MVQTCVTKGGFRCWRFEAHRDGGSATKSRQDVYEGVVIGMVRVGTLPKN